MKKYYHQLTKQIGDLFFFILMVATLLSLFFGSKAHGQMADASNRVMLGANNASAINNPLFDAPVVNKAEDEMVFSPNPTKQFVNIYFNREVTNIVVFDLSNTVVEDVVIDMSNKKVDFSAICEGIYYIRVDYVGGSHLRRIILE